MAWHDRGAIAIIFVFGIVYSVTQAEFAAYIFTGYWLLATGYWFMFSL